MAHFIKYKEVIDKYSIDPQDQSNFDETGYRISMASNDYIVSASKDRRIYNKHPSNRKSLTVVECINRTGRDITSILILTGISILAPFFLNDLSDDVLIILKIQFLPAQL